MALANEEYLVAGEETDRIEQRAAQASDEVASAESKWNELKARLGERVRLLYKHPTAALDAWLGARSFSELERAWPNYLGAKLLAATLWHRNPATRHDAPVSVRRAFTTAELLDIARDAGCRDARVFRHFFYRLVLVVRK